MESLHYGYGSRDARQGCVAGWVTRRDEMRHKAALEGGQAGSGDVRDGSRLREGSAGRSRAASSSRASPAGTPMGVKGGTTDIKCRQRFRWRRRLPASERARGGCWYSATRTGRGAGLGQPCQRCWPAIVGSPDQRAPIGKASARSRLGRRYSWRRYEVRWAAAGRAQRGSDGGARAPGSHPRCSRMCLNSW